jgi:nucleotide-binding universal stress UspA family protein
MYQHLLIATDGSELAQKAVEHGLSLAKTVRGTATAVTVTEPGNSVVPEENAERILSVVRDAAETLGVRCDTLHMKNQSPADGIIEAAKSQGCDLIVMASHGRRGFAKFLLGSQANKVVTQSTIPVLICR